MEIAIGIVATAILAVFGFLLRRWWTGEGHLARVDRLEKLASLYSKLQEQGITPDDLDKFDALIQKRAQFEEEIEEVRIEADPLRRLRDEPLPQQTMNKLAHQAADFADTELERAYQDALACFDGADRDRFVAAHTVWDEYRRQESHFEREIFHGGSMATMIGALEYEAITRQRTARLRALRHAYTAALNPKAEDSIGSLIQGLRASYPGDRERAAREIGRLGQTAARAVPALRKALKDSSGPVRTAAAYALHAIGTAEAIKILREYESR